ncbi:MAG: hypothetical protein KatS3mg051_2240 [Anaerolineae bacterium]|nr:MAG: hypothetical protein KatS3mg051_2240 [Anaerolineae bacterium]
MNRRDFLKAVGVVSGGAVVAGCEPKKGTYKAIAPALPPTGGQSARRAVLHPHDLHGVSRQGCGVTVRVIRRSAHQA